MQSFTWGECLEHFMSKVFQPATLAGAISIALISTISFANTETNVIQLETIFVTASKSEQNVEDIPARVAVIDEETIQKSPILDLAHLLSKEASISISQSGGYGQPASAHTRGTKSAHTLFMQDGMRLNTASVESQTNIHLLDTSSIDRIEILKGPASVQYGSDAIGGVVQLISKTPTQNQVFNTIEAGERATYKNILGADLAQDGAYLQIRGQRLETDGDIIVQNTAVKSAYDQKGYSAKVGTIQDHYGLSAEITNNQGTSNYFFQFNPNNLGMYDFENQLLNLTGYLQLNQNLKFNTRLSQFEDERTETLGYASYVTTKQQEIDTNLQWALNPQQNLLIGIQHNQTDVESRNFFNYDIHTTGYYVQHQYADHGLNTQIGLRVEDNEQFGTHTVGQVAVRYQLLPLTSIYTNIGTAFKAPAVGQLTPEPVWWGGNPDLQPEESVSYEIGIDQKLADGLNAYASIYQTKIKDLQKTDANYVWKNTNKAKLTGAELGLKWSSDNWYAAGEYAYVQPKDDTKDIDLEHSPRQNFSLTTGWESELYGVSLSLIAKGKAKDARQNLSGYSTVDLGAFWNAHQNVRFFANIRNVLDKNYHTAAFSPTQYYLAEGRLASAGVTLRY